MSMETTDRPQQRPRVNGRFVAVPLTAASGYFTKHDKVKYVRGSASQFLCADGCGRQARHSATIHGRDGLDIWADYQPMAARCHVFYDGTSICLRRGEDVPSAKLTAAGVLELRELYATKEWTPRQLAGKYGVSPVTIGDIVIRHRSWRWLT